MGNDANNTHDAFRALFDTAHDESTPIGMLRKLASILATSSNDVRRSESRLIASAANAMQAEHDAALAAERARAEDLAALVEGHTRERDAFLALLGAMGLRVVGAHDLCGAVKGALALAEDRARAAEREACAARVKALAADPHGDIGTGWSGGWEAAIEEAERAIRTRSPR